MLDEEEIKLKRRERLVDLLLLATAERHKTLPIISSLCAMLLVVATFNTNLLSVTFLFKVLLSILLFLIPISLFLYLADFNKLANKVEKLLKDEIGDWRGDSTCWEKITAYFPWIGTFILSLVIICLVVLFWVHH